MLCKGTLTFIIAFWFMTSIAHGATVQEFTDAEEWQSAMSSFETIGFTEGEDLEYIGDDYAASHGATFTNAYYWNLPNTFHDEWGFVSDWAFPGGSGAWVDFETPQFGVAVDHPGIIAFELSYEGEVIFTSDGNMGGSGLGFFSGVISSEPFDSVYLHKQFPAEGDEVTIDDLHFGTIPAPGALGLLAFAALLGRSRRRRKT